MMLTEPRLAIGRRLIGASLPCYIIAEIGVNHNGDLALARKMVDEAHRAGADAVKFQTFKTEANILPNAPKAEYQLRETGGGSQFDMVRKLELPFAAFTELKLYCDSIGIDFITTAFDAEALDFVISLKPPCLKWPSGELTNLNLLRQAAASGLPVLLSTGMSDLAEIDRAVAVLRPHCDYVVMQCVSNYPAALEDQNLRTLPVLQAAFGCPVGFSDHTLGPVAALAARALGMAVLEKHFTLDREMEGPDHRASMEPREFASLVRTLRQLEAGLGDGIKRCTAAEENTKAVARKSLVFNQALPEGHRLRADDLIAKRPATGTGPEHIDLFIGRVLARDVQANALARFSDIVEE